MDRRFALTVVVALCVGLSGCSALPVWDGDGASEPTPETETPTATQTAESIPEADPGGDEGEAPSDAEYPTGYGPDGLEDPGSATAAHVDGLLGVSEYLFSYQSRLETAEGNASFTYTAAADNDDEVAYIVRDTGQGAQAAYYEDDRVYVRDESGDETRYNDSDRTYEMQEFTGVQFIAPLLGSVEYGDAEVIDTEAGTFFRYTSENVTEPEEILGTQVDEERIERFDVGIVVDTDGVIRDAAFAVEADNDVTARMSVGQINSTNVDRPEWFDEADGS